jgi:hypothetical protein
MPIGKYKGWLLRDIPTDYLWWLQTIARGPQLRTALAAELKRRDPVGPESEPEPTPAKSGIPVWEGVVKRWFAALAMKYHPDRGGTNAVMAALNHARDEIVRLFREAGDADV